MLFILVGGIGVGKSSWAQKRANNDRTLVINDDAIVNMVHGNNYRLYDSENQAIYKGIENAIMSYAALMQFDLIIDSGLNIKKARRQRYISMWNSFTHRDNRIVAIVFPKLSPKYHAKKRFENDNRGYSYEKWLCVAEAFDALYEYPTLDEGFTEIDCMLYLNGIKSQ